MNDRQNESTPQAVDKSLQPALIISRHSMSEHSMFIARLLVGLADESIPTALVCPPDSEVDSIVSGAVEVIRYPSINLPLMGRQNRERLIGQLRKFKPTVLHCLCEVQAKLTWQLARQLDLPCILTVNSLQKQRWRVPAALRRCAKLIVPARSIAANIAQVFPQAASRIAQINIGAFIEETSSCFNEPSRLASMVVAHPVDNVGDFEKLFGAIRRLAIEGYEFMVVVMGSGRAERQLRRLLAALGLLQTVTIVPRLKPWRSALIAGDIFIQPQPNTAFNHMLLEAMSVGTAVAACKGGVDDLIIEDRTAVVFDPNDELSIYGCLQQLLHRQEFARKIARGAQDYLRENHTVSKMISATLQTYREAQAG